MFSQIREVSIVVHNLDEAVATYSSTLGLTPSAVHSDPRPPIQSRSATFKIGESCIALMEATEPDSPIARFLEKRGEGLFSIALAVPNLDSASDDLRRNGADLLLDSPMEFPSFPAYDRVYSLARMNFVRPKSLHGVLVEVQELHG